jgi:soluble lytic murein transglycosylase-like protein
LAPFLLLSRGMNNMIHSKRLQIVALNLMGILIIYAVSFCYGKQSSGGWAGKDVVPYSDEISLAAKANDLNPALIAAVIHAESNFKPNARSYVGARGLMQIMPSTMRYLRAGNAANPRDNIFAGSKYLRELLDRFDGDLVFAIAAYNAGPGAVMKHDGVPPYKETRNYVKKVLAHYDHYKKIFASDPLMS